MKPFDVKVIDLSEEVRIHTFICPEDFLSVATHVIEGPNKLIVVDGQLVNYYAHAFRKYVDDIGKPIERVYLSHDHPDHFFGLSAAFYDLPIYALPETIDSLIESGETIRSELKHIFGEGVPDFIVIPEHKVGLDDQLIDGIRFSFDRVTDAEVKFQLVIKLPDYGVTILQDLLYSGSHVYIESTALENWTDYLEEMATHEKMLFMPGHGEPADHKEVLANIDYIKTVVGLAIKYQPDVAAYKAAVLELYPDRMAPQIIDIYGPRLFGETQ
ncbi:MBL fold metallo-hydrolase [Fusibacter sp. A1]|nr:MBL fold metallo-hydrolase [Fusibacter sp. A1]RXV60382.1 MBL fold metallo-hydrolase [Fusibacter sp. A1]